MTLMPVSNIWARGSSWSKSGAGRWISQRSSTGPMSSVSSGLAQHVEDVPEDDVAHRHRDAAAGVAHGRPPHQAVGRLHADAAHPPLADLLGHLGGDRDLAALEVQVDLDGVVDLGEGVGRELDVDDRTGDGDDAALFERLLADRWGLAVRWWS